MSHELPDSAAKVELDGELSATSAARAELDGGLPGSSGKTEAHGGQHLHHYQ